MFYKKKEAPIIISVGGSLIVPSGGIDIEFLKKLNEFIREYVKKGKRFFLIAGGGQTTRHYQKAGKAVIESMDNEDLDWIGIHATHLNGHLLRTIFNDIANPRVIQHYDRKLTNWKESVVIGAGWKPGWTTDYDAVKSAQDYGGKLVINMSNIDWVYDKDPNKFKDAKLIKKITWGEMIKIVGKKYSPGMNVPFDPVATQLANKLNLTVIITNGNDFVNMRKIIDGDEFKGTVITPFKIDAEFYDREYYTGKKGEYRIAHVESIFGRFFHGLVNFYRALMIRLFINPKNCLDVGCGTGGLVKSLRWLGIDAYGVEISKIALELADKDVKPYLKEGDIIKLPYKDNQFDLVLTYDVLEHLEKSKIQKAVNEVMRVAKKNVLHKIYTVENTWIEFLHARDFSHLSVESKSFWQGIFSGLENSSILRSSIFKLPSFFETIFLLKKK